jgi:tRNA G18 (ribose-2'-O)-methylase SpoU
LEKCPLCGSIGRINEYGYPVGENLGINAATPNNHLEVLLDNLRSIYNVGSIFRTSDGAGVRKLYLGGYTPTPEHPKLRKTGLGSEWYVPWDSVRNGSDLVLSKKSEGYHIYVLERTPSAISIFESKPIAPVSPILLVIGNEKVGVDPEIITNSHRVVYIPMAGRKRSLNVATAFGIAAYALAVNQNSL